MKVREKKVRSNPEGQSLHQAYPVRSCLVCGPDAQNLFVGLVLESQAATWWEKSIDCVGAEDFDDYLRHTDKRIRI